MTHCTMPIALREMIPKLLSRMRANAANICYHHLRNDVTLSADDLVQEGVYRMLRATYTVQKTEDDLLAWSYTIMRNHAINIGLSNQRKLLRTAGYFEQEAFLQLEDPYEKQRDKLVSVIPLLSQPQQETLFTQLNNLTPREGAAALGILDVTFRGRLHLAKPAIHTLLANHCH